MRSWNELSMAEKADVMKLAIEGGVYDLDSIRSGYNEYANGGDKDDPPITTRRTGHSPSSYTSGVVRGIRTAGKKVAKRVATDVRQRLYDNIIPYGYRNPVGRAFSALVLNKPSDSEVMPASGNVDALDELWAEYLQIPKDRKHYDSALKKSKYRHSKESNNNATYFALPLDDEERQYIVNKALNNDSIGLNPELGRYKISLGEDENGRYASYYDSWDINPFRGTTAVGGAPAKFFGLNKIEDVSLGIGKPVEVYDRIYFNDFGQAEPSRQVTLPEVVITGKKHSEGGKIHIDPSKRGTFTAAASKHGKSVQEFASQVLAHPDNYSPAMRKKANFARNASKWKHGDGGSLFGGKKEGIQQMVTTGLAWYIPPVSQNIINQAISFADNKAYKLSQYLMGLAGHSDGSTRQENGEPTESVAQATYLLPRRIQKNKFLEYGYTEAPGDYGLVKKAVGNRNLPVYQKNPDAITRDKLNVIGNTYLWNGNPDEDLTHAGSYPTALYHDAEGNIYQKGWDLNDYGGASGGAYNYYNTIDKIKANFADFIGSPVVVTTGFRPTYNWETNGMSTLANPKTEIAPIVDDYLKSKGLVRHTRIDENGRPTGYKKDFIGLPEVVITGKRKKKHDTGGLLETDNELKTRPNRHWKHGLGGNLFYDGGEEDNQLAYDSELGNYYGGLGDIWNFLKTGVKKARKKISDWGFDRSPADHLIELFTPEQQQRQNRYIAADGSSWNSKKEAVRHNSDLVNTGKYYFQRASSNSGVKQKMVLRKPNTSPTAQKSMELENNMYTGIDGFRERVRHRTKPYDIPYGDREIVVKPAGSTVPISISVNALDSLAKYAGMTGTPIEKALGLAMQETAFGRNPLYNYDELGPNYSNRDLGNANYFKNFGSIPAEYLVRDFRYNADQVINGRRDEPIPLEVQPLRHALEYLNAGKYNTKDPNHTRDVNTTGNSLWNETTGSLHSWWKGSGQSQYNEGAKQKKK